LDTPSYIRHESAKCKNQNSFSLNNTGPTEFLLKSSRALSSSVQPVAAGFHTFLSYCSPLVRISKR